MSGAFASALGAVRSYGAALGVDAHEHVVDEGWATLVYAWELGDALASVREADGVVGAGATVVLRLPVDASTCTLTSDSAGTWIPDGLDPSAVLPHLVDAPPQAAWATEELLAGDAAEGFAAVTGGTATITLGKERWRTDLERETGRSVWIGPSADGFATWLQDTIPVQIAERLFAAPGCLVALEGWAAPPVGGDGRLVTGSLEHRPPRHVEEGALAERLAGRGETDLLPSWRLLDVDPLAQPRAIREPLQRARGLIAARLLAEVAEGDRLRPSAVQATEWTLPATPGGADGEFTALIALVRWVGDDLGEARFEVARDLAARRIEDPAHTLAGDPIVRAARLAYRLNVQRDVRASLDHQQRLEEAFRALDDRVAEMRAKLADGVDSALTKAIAGGLAITIAALTSAAVRDWPATIASWVLTLYLALAAVGVWHLRGDSTKRLDEARALAEGRVEGLGDRLSNSLDAWSDSLTRRANGAVLILALAAIAVFVGGLAQNAQIF